MLNNVSQTNPAADLLKKTGVVLASILLASLLTACDDGDSTTTTNPTNTTATDSDGDGVPNTSDAFPNDATETADTDKDGVGNNADAFPNDATESVDTDKDGTGNNADTDDDGDGVPDATDTDPLDPTKPGSTPTFPATGLSKVDASGNLTTGDAVCIRDNDNKLLWEVKTTSGFRNMSGKYKSGTGGQAPDAGGECTDLTACDTTTYLAEMNKGVCGTTAWRLPSLTQANIDLGEKGEFAGIFDGTAAVAPAINALFLPNTVAWVDGEEGYCTSKGNVGINFNVSGWPYTVSGVRCHMRAVATVQ